MTYTERNPQVHIINVIIITFEEDEKLFKKNSMRMRYGCILLFSFYRFCLFFFPYVLYQQLFARGEAFLPRTNISHISRASDIIFVCFFFCTFVITISNIVSAFHGQYIPVCFRPQLILHRGRKQYSATCSLPFFSFS